MTTRSVGKEDVVLSVGDTTYLDYGGILVKREGYGPPGNGGNGLLLHSALALDLKGQPIGEPSLLLMKPRSRKNNDAPRLARPIGLAPLKQKNPIDG